MRTRRCIVAVAVSIIAVTATGCSSSDDASSATSLGPEPSTSAATGATSATTTTAPASASTIPASVAASTTPASSAAPVPGSVAGPTPGPGLDQYGLDDQQVVCVQIRVGLATDPADVPADDLAGIVARCVEIADPLEELDQRVAEAYGDELTGDELGCMADTARDLNDNEVQLAILATEPSTGEPSGESSAVLAGLFLACGGLPSE